MRAGTTRFDERRFDTLEYNGVTVRSRELDGTEDWLTMEDDPILNTAFMPDGLTLVLSHERRVAVPGSMPLAPLDDAPSRLLALFHSGDMTFAAC